MRLLKTCLVLALAFLAAGPLEAQSLTGSIKGVVRDEQGGALPGTSVTLTGKTGARTAVSDAQGEYRFPVVDPGSYELSIEMAGFQTLRRTGIQISIGKILEFDFSMKVATVTETVEVLGEAPVVDVTSTQTSNTISQDLLFNLPLQRFAPDLLNYAPGINNDSAYGAGSGNNALLIDGVDTRDPEGGTAWSFFNFNVIEEVQLQGLGAPAEYGAFTGAIFNSITKSGGNDFSGLFDANYSRASFSSDNISSAVKQANPTVEPSVTTNFLDWTAQIGGPLRKDKLFFFASAQRYHLELNPNGPRTIRDELSHRFNGKLNWLPRSNDSVNLHIEYDDYSITGRPGYDASIDTDAQTVREDAPEWVWNAQWRHLFGANTFLEAKYLGWWGYYYLDPETPGPLYYDSTTNSFNTQPPGSAFAGLPSSNGSFYYADRGRHEAHAALSHYAEAFGKHDLKFGVQIERSRVRNRWGYPTGVNYYDYPAYYPVGQYYAYTYGYDVAGKNERESIYAQDSWKPNDRLTINAGVRFDWIRGKGDRNSESLGKVYDTKNLAPRIGFAWDMTGDHKTVLKAHYGQYYEGAMFTLYQRALPGTEDYVGYCYDGVTQEPGGPPGFSECNRVDYSTTYDIDPNVKHPRVDEFTLGFERALASDFRLAVTGIWRDTKNQVDAVLPNARFEPATITPSLSENAATAPTAPLDVFRWTNRPDSQSGGLITNVDGWRYLDPSGNAVATIDASRRYRALMFVLNKRYTNRWQAQLSYVVSKNEGTLDNRGFGNYAGLSNNWKTPNTGVLNRDGNLGYDARHEVKLLASYRIPKIDLAVNGYYRFLSGLPYNTLYRLVSADRAELGYTSIPSSLRTLFLEPRGSRHLDSQSTLDLRLDKIFKLGGRKEQLSFYVDIQNVFNKDTVSEIWTRAETDTTLGSATATTPDCPCTVPFEGPLAVIPGRQFTLGARWSF
jgi:outer membrane receptor protein involved in Fe transport